MKFLYLFNTVLQLYAIRLLLEQTWTVSDTFQGFRRIFTPGLLRANPLSKYFPKISMCDFRIIEPNSDDGHKYTVQCKSSPDDCVQRSRCAMRGKDSARLEGTLMSCSIY